MGTTLTELAVRNAKPRPKKYKLTGGRGLTLLVMPNGAKYWRLRYWHAGKRKEVTVGKPYPVTSLRDAALEADRLRTVVADGVDPAEQRLRKRFEEEERVAHTVGDAAKAWHKFRAKAWKEITTQHVREYLDRDLLPILGHRPLANVTTRELASFTSNIEERGAPDVAMKMRQWLSSIFSYARAQGWTDNDPVRDLRSIVLPCGVRRNYPHLPLEQLPDFLQALDNLRASPILKGATMLALWTANRPGVTRTLRWSELDLEAGIWRIERGRDGMKRGYRHTTPLPVQAVRMLRELEPISGTFDYVFIGRNDPSKPISDGALNGILKRLGYRGKQTTHGFRHILSTALNELGYAPDWVERQLAHGDLDKIRATYNKADYLDARREMLQRWANLIDRMRQGEPWEAVKTTRLPFGVESVVTDHLKK